MTRRDILIVTVGVIEICLHHAGIRNVDREIIHV